MPEEKRENFCSFCTNCYETICNKRSFVYLRCFLSFPASFRPAFSPSAGQWTSPSLFKTHVFYVFYLSSF